MNWEEIKEKYPLAYNYCIASLDAWNLLGDDSEPENKEALYFFFDKQGIMIEIGVDFTRAGYGRPLYCYRVNDFKEFEDINKAGAPWSELERTRKDAELEAFDCAFATMESKLDKIQLPEEFQD